MKPETDQERQERKALFIARATAHFDSPEIRKEAAEKWEEANKSMKSHKAIKPVKTWAKVWKDDGQFFDVWLPWEQLYSPLKDYKEKDKDVFTIPVLITPITKKRK